MSQVGEYKKIFYKLSFIMKRELNSGEVSRITSWMVDEKIDEDLIVKVFEYCVYEKGVKHINYISTVLRSWNEKEIVKSNHRKLLFKKEFIARYYFLDQVEIGGTVEACDLITVLDNDMTLEEFEEWLDKYDERMNFVEWITENDLETIWNYN